MTPQIQEHLWQSTVASPQSPQDFHSQPYGIFLYWGFLVKRNERNERQFFLSAETLPRGVSAVKQSITYITSIFFMTVIFFQTDGMTS